MNVLITGASRGIGRAIAEKFASEGFNIIINYNKSKLEDVEKLKEYLENKYNIKVLCLKCDVSQEEEVKKLFSDIKKWCEKLDCIVNNAGIANDMPLDEKTSFDFLDVLKVNLLGTFLICKYGYKLIDEGSIINMSSNNAYGGYIESVDYDASKAGVIALTHDFAKYLSPKIRVNCLCPGWIDTDMNKNMFEEFREKEKNKILLKKFGEAKDIAEAVYFLATNQYINNAIIKVDGGYEN